MSDMPKDPMSDFCELAVFLHEYHKELQGVGFTRDEATRIVAADVSRPRVTRF